MTKSAPLPVLEQLGITREEAKRNVLKLSPPHFLRRLKNTDQSYDAYSLFPILEKVSGLSPYACVKFYSNAGERKGHFDDI